MTEGEGEQELLFGQVDGKGERREGEFVAEDGDQQTLFVFLQRDLAAWAPRRRWRMMGMSQGSGLER